MLNQEPEYDSEEYDEFQKDLDNFEISPIKDSDSSEDENNLMVYRSSRKVVSSQRLDKPQ